MKSKTAKNPTETFGKGDFPKHLPQKFQLYEWDFQIKCPCILYLLKKEFFKKVADIQS